MKNEGIVLVTGASGNVGRHVVRLLRESGLPARAAVRGASEREDQVAFDFEDPATFGPALEGVARIFLMRPPHISKVEGTINAFLDEAAKREVAHVVFLSVTGAEKNRYVPHHGIEQRLRRGDLPWTILRPGFFAQNLGDQYRADIVRDGRIFVPAGKGKVAFVDVRDVAEVAVRAFGDPATHLGKAWTLTGPEAIDFAQAAQILSSALGRDIRYVPASIIGSLRHLRRQGQGFGQAAVITLLHAGIRFGQAERVDPTLGQLLGRPGRSIADYVRDHLPLWAAGEQGPGRC